VSGARQPVVDSSAELFFVAAPKQHGCRDNINGCTVNGDLARPSTQPKQRKDSENDDNDTDQPKNVVHSFLPV
jgi:hypothetical protein